MLEKIKKGYYYFYYKIYKLIDYTSEELGGAAWTDFKAGIVIIALEVWTLLSVFNYYTVITKIWLKLSLKNPIILIPFIFIILINYIAFAYNDAWKSYNKEFDKLPEKINRKGSLIVIGISVVIITNLIFSYYLLFQVKNV